MESSLGSTFLPVAPAIESRKSVLVAAHDKK